MKKLGNDKIAIFIILIILIILGIVFIPKLSMMSDEDNVNESIQDNDTFANMSIKTEEIEMTKIKLTTNHGEIVIELYSDMPITTGNFEKLTNDGIYNGVIFHRIIDEFMIQGGDPTGTGFGDPSIPNIEDEFTHAGGNKNDLGTISMANAGPNTGSSQFFINVNPDGNNFLDSKHPAFGKVVEGMDVVDKIAKVQVGANDKPVEDVVIEKAEIIQ
jgi:peptidylprolyl isomerase